MKIIIPLTIVILLLISGTVLGESYKGYFITTASKTQVVGEFKNLSDYFECTYEGRSVRVPTKEIKEVTITRIGKAILLKRDGKEFMVGTDYGKHVDGNMYGWMGNGALSFTYYDEINNKYSTDSINYRKVRKIVLDKDYGDLRKCPSCKRTFIPEYLFCPFDKTELKLIKIGP